MKINLNDDLMTAAVKMSGGNPGAANAIVKILSHSREIDPNDILGGMGYLLQLDSLGIYGTGIYVLYNDICLNDITKTISVLKAVQLGLFSGETLKLACSKQDRSGRQMVPVDELYTQVKAQLQNFG